MHIMLHTLCESWNVFVQLFYSHKRVFVPCGLAEMYRMRYEGPVMHIMRMQRACFPNHALHKWWSYITAAESSDPLTLVIAIECLRTTRQQQCSAWPSWFPAFTAIFTFCSWEIHIHYTLSNFPPLSLLFSHPHMMFWRWFSNIEGYCAFLLWRFGAHDLYK